MAMYCAECGTYCCLGANSPEGCLVRYDSTITHLKPLEVQVDGDDWISGGLNGCIRLARTPTQAKSVLFDNGCFDVLEWAYEVFELAATRHIPLDAAIAVFRPCK